MLAATFTMSAFISALSVGMEPLSASEPEGVLRFLRGWLLWSTILLVAATVGLVAVLRLSRRLRQRLELSRDKSVDTSDVWTRYRLPEDWDADDSNPSDDEESESD